MHIPYNVSPIMDDTGYAVYSAIRDIIRHTPDQKVYEIAVESKAITGEVTSWYGELGLLFTAYRPVRRFSERLYYEVAGVRTYLVRNTDYYINYQDGRIQTTRDIVLTVYIDYELDNYAIDLLPLHTFSGEDEQHGFVRVTAVEYPLGKTPQQFIPFDVWGYILFPHWPIESGSSSLKKHIAVHYETEYIMDWIGNQVPYQSAGDILGNFVTTMRIELSDPDWDSWTDPELVEFIYKAAKDVPRYVPLQYTREYELDFGTVTEEFTVLESYPIVEGKVTIHQLDHPVEPFTEEIWDGPDKTGAKYIRDYDYEMDYSNGVVGFGVGSNAAFTCRFLPGYTYYITYRKNPRLLDISDIDSIQVQNYGGYPNWIRVVAVEYPVDHRPRRFVPFSIWDNKLKLVDRVTDGHLIRLYVEGEYPIRQID